MIINSVFIIVASTRKFCETGVCPTDPQVEDISNMIEHYLGYNYVL